MRVRPARGAVRRKRGKEAGSPSELASPDAAFDGDNEFEGEEGEEGEAGSADGRGGSQAAVVAEAAAAAAAEAQDKERAAARERVEVERRQAAAAMGSTEHKLMGGTQYELLDPHHRYGVWHKSVTFATFYKWYMTNPAALALRQRAPLAGACSSRACPCLHTHRCALAQTCSPVAQAGGGAGDGRQGDGHLPRRARDAEAARGGHDAGGHHSRATEGVSVPQPTRGRLWPLRPGLWS